MIKKFDTNIYYIKKKKLRMSCIRKVMIIISTRNEGLYNMLYQ